MSIFLPALILSLCAAYQACHWKDEEPTNYDISTYALGFIALCALLEQIA